jgi:hypothetical protein
LATHVRVELRKKWALKSRGSGLGGPLIRLESCPYSLQIIKFRTFRHSFDGRLC